MTYKLPKEATEIIDHYFNLKIGNKKIRCPYYINLKRTKDLRALVGKGTPEEIELEVQIWAKLRGIDLIKSSEKEIREFLINEGIGIDCSGFVIHVINGWYKAVNGKNIWSKLKPMKNDIIHRLAYKLKPVEKLGAEIITNLENSETIEIGNVLPGDVIRTKWKRKNSHHILLVSKIEKDSKGNVKIIEYTHSIPFYDEKSGVKTGEIEVIHQNKPLQDQKWLEVDDSGVNHVYEGFLINVEDNGLRRVKAMKNIIELNAQQNNSD